MRRREASSSHNTIMPLNIVCSVLECCGWLLFTCHPKDNENIMFDYYRGELGTRKDTTDVCETKYFKLISKYH